MLHSSTSLKILITGGAGMIGSTLARRLVRAGAEVHIVDAMLPLYGGNRFNLTEVENSIKFVTGDIRDPNLMKQLVQGMDIIFDLAAQVSYVHSNRDPLLDADINCLGHLVVLEACRQHNPSAKIVFSSSRFVYGTIDYVPVDENHPTNCRSIYGIHKLTAEKYMQFYNSAYGLDTTCVRIANPYGPRQQMKHSAYGIVNWFVRLALDGQPLTIYGDGNQVRDYVYVEDLAAALVATALSKHTSGKILNIGSGKGTPFREMVDLIAQYIPDTQVQRVPWPPERYFVESGDYISDLSRIRAATDWVPETTFKQGVRSTIEYYRAFREHYWSREQQLISKA